MVPHPGDDWELGQQPALARAQLPSLAPVIPRLSHPRFTSSPRQEVGRSGQYELPPWSSSKLTLVIFSFWEASWVASSGELLGRDRPPLLLLADPRRLSLFQLLSIHGLALDRNPFGQVRSSAGSPRFHAGQPRLDDDLGSVDELRSSPPSFIPQRSWINADRSIFTGLFPLCQARRRSQRRQRPAISVRPSPSPRCSVALTR